MLLKTQIQCYRRHKHDEMLKMHTDRKEVCAQSWKLEEAQIRTHSSLMQLHKHIGIFAYMQYANICAYNMQISAHAICKYLQMQYNAYYTFDRHAVEVNRSYLLPLSQSSPAQGICKTAFLKHPGSFWLQKTGHGA